MFALVRCVAQAVAEVGVRGLAQLVPGGKVACDIAANALAKYRALKRDRELRDDIRKLAAATFDEAKAAAVEAVREVAPDAAPEDRLNLELFLTHVPPTVQASLKRPDDPTGRTVPAAFDVRTPDDMLRLLPPRLPRFRPGDPLPGATGWVLVEQLGAGGFGEVWLARFGSNPAGHQGAVKFCHGLDPRDLRHELKLVARVTQELGEHPGIVPILADDLDADPPWVMYEYVAGGDLVAQVREWAALAPEVRTRKAVAALRELADVVGTLHKLSPAVVHRDLKPTNVLVSGDRRQGTGNSSEGDRRQGTGDRKTRNRGSELSPASCLLSPGLRITDFGIGGVAAAAALRAERTGESSSGGRLRSNLRGSHTPLYASPQQRDGADPDPRDDVHALGVIGYQLVTGHLGQGVGTDFDDDLRDAGAPDALAAVLKKCTAQKPERRWADANELARALDQLSAPVDTRALSRADESTLAADYARCRDELHRARSMRAWIRDFAPKRVARWRDAAERNDPRALTLLGCAARHGAGVPHNYFWAMTWFKKAAGLGDSLAEVSLGEMHHAGHGVPQDDAKAAGWFKKAADRGDPLALYHLGRARQHGLGVPQDTPVAVEWYRKAADLGLAAARNALGCLLLEGRGVKRDRAAALDWFRKAAEQGDADGQYNVGLLTRGSDPEAAVGWFRKAAAQSHAGAEHKLGVAHEHGRGVVRDPAAAAAWYRVAAVRGHAAAQVALGNLCRRGYGVPRDDAQALDWFSRAAEKDDPDALCALGEMYAVGSGVACEYAQAVRWFRRAVALGHADAEYQMGCLYEHGNGVPQDFHEAMACFRRASARGHAGAEYALGRFYRNGLGVPRNEGQALDWFRKAADRGHPDAQLSVGVLYSQGRGVPKDAAAATTWFQKAAAQGNEAAKGWLKSLGVA